MHGLWQVNTRASWQPLTPQVSRKGVTEDTTIRPDSLISHNTLVTVAPESDAEEFLYSMQLLNRKLL